MILIAYDNLAAYQMGIEAHGEAYMRKRFEASAVRLLKNIFRVGLFENPYLDVAETEKTVGKAEFMQAGYDAQLRSVVMLKNEQQTLPLTGRKKVYVPQRYIPATTNWWGMTSEPRTEHPFNMEVIAKYFDLVDNPQEADFALVGIKSPDGGVGYDRADIETGGNGYVPISLQYGPYTATEARATSLAGGSPLEDFTNRSYRGKSVTSTNITDMQMVKDTRTQLGDKAVIVVVQVAKPMIFSEIEPSASAILVHMGVQDQALMELLTGKQEPSALLPFQMPKNMTTVEQQMEDVPRDMQPYVDAAGNAYDFAFGLNWSGVITDERVKKYR
jgi:beta-glucosidase